MSATQTAASVATQPAKQPNGFIRFIDAIGHLFVKAQPVVHAVEAAAVAAEPVLALTPFGPEYAIAVNAVTGAQQIAEASIDAGGPSMSNTDKFGIAVAAATPALNTILASKGITQGTQTHVDTWIQTVFNILAGPVAALANHSTAQLAASPAASQTPQTAAVKA